MPWNFNSKTRHSVVEKVLKNIGLIYTLGFMVAQKLCAALKQIIDFSLYVCTVLLDWISAFSKVAKQQYAEDSSQRELKQFLMLLCVM